MLPGRRLHRACPACRKQVIHFLGGGSRHAPSWRSAPSPSVIAPTYPVPLRRHFSTTRPSFQDTEPSKEPPSNKEIEAFVRQAKETFGNTLPKDYLTKEEFKVYERLFGPPLRETTLADVGIGLLNVNPAEDAALKEPGQQEHGVLDTEYTLHATEDVEAESVEAEDLEAEDVKTEDAADLVENQDTPYNYISAVAKNQREYDALAKLQKDFEDALERISEEEQDALDEHQDQAISARQEEELLREEQEDEEEDMDDEAEYGPGTTLGSFPSSLQKRFHPLSLQGKFGTFPSTVELPKGSLVAPIENLLRRTDNTHIQEAARESLGGRGLPYSPATPPSKTVPMKALGLQASHHRMTEIRADAFLATIIPGIYASAMSVLVEVRKRLGSEWIRNLASRSSGGPRVLDVGAGGAGLAAWNRVFRAEWNALYEQREVQDPKPPEEKKGERTVIVGSDALRNRLSRFLFNTTFLPRLPDYIHSAENADRLLDAPQNPQSRKKYDVIIATHLLMALKEPHKRRELLNNLWAQLNPEGGVLIVLEKGHPRGFEAIADVRQRLLDEFILPPTQTKQETIEGPSQPFREPGMIVAPCTNHTKCPMYLTPGLSPGRKDLCYFSQRFSRPKFLQKVHGFSRADHEDVEFSYIAVRRGGPNPAVPSFDTLGASTLAQGKQAADKAFKGYEVSTTSPHLLSLPRNLLPPLKRRGHVTIDLCTPEGRVERWTVPKSFSRQAYHDARKARWGDLWALGAKVRVPRNIRLGRGAVDGGGVVLDGGVRSQRALQNAKQGARVIEVSRGLDGKIQATEKKGLIRHERRTKKGRKPKPRDLLKELEDAEDVDDRDNETEYLRKSRQEREDGEEK